MKDHAGEERRGGGMRTANSYIRKTIDEIGIDIRSKKARIPDEVTFHIRELQKELLFSKGINVLNFKDLTQLIKKKSEEEQKTNERLKAGKEVQKSFFLLLKKYK